MSSSDSKKRPREEAIYYFDARKALPRAVMQRRPEAVRALLGKGHDANTRDKMTGNTVAHIAVVYRVPEILQLLVEAGADVNARNNHGATPMMTPGLYDYKEKDNETKALLEILVAAGADADIPNFYGSTPMSDSVVKQMPLTTELLIDAGGTVPPSLAACAKTPRIRELVSAAIVWPTSLRCAWITACVKGGVLEN